MTPLSPLSPSLSPTSDNVVYQWIVQLVKAGLLTKRDSGSKEGRSAQPERLAAIFGIGKRK